MIPWWKTDFGELEVAKVSDSIRNRHISQGPVTLEFERQLARVLDVPYVIATTSGSMAILMALIAAGIGPGDEVIVPNRTWIATAHAPHLLGAKVTLVDVEKQRPIIDVKEIENVITKNTKAIVPVHLNGRAANLHEVNRIAEEYGLVVIEDAAQAFCSKNRLGYLGCQSFAGCFSLSVAKLISTGQGGFIATKQKELYDKLHIMRSHGVHDPVHARYTQFGFNFRFTDILASIGLMQLARVKSRIEGVKEVYELYESALRDLYYLEMIPVKLNEGEIPIYVEIVTQYREKLIKFLEQNNIQIRPFYPDLDRAEYLCSSGEFINSRKFGEQGLFLPSGPDQPKKNIECVIEALWKFQKEL